MQNVTVRRSRSGDEPGLARLAALDSTSPPRGPALIAEAESRMLAAIPLESGRAIADPFAHTEALVALLELRKAQIAAAEADSPGAGDRVRSLLSRATHARAS